MINYHFDITNKYHPFTHQSDANANTYQPDNALRIQPIAKIGFWPCESDGDWILVEDHRGQTIYNVETKLSKEVRELGPIECNFTLLKPFEFSKWDGEKWVLDIDAKNTHTIQQNIALREQLINIANEQITILERAIKYNRATDADKLLLEQLEIFTIDVSQADLSDPDLIFPELPKNPIRAFQE